MASAEQLRAEKIELQAKLSRLEKAGPRDGRRAQQGARAMRDRSRSSASKSSARPMPSRARPRREVIEYEYEHTGGEAASSAQDHPHHRLTVALDDARERLTELLSRCHDDPDLFNSAILGRPAYWSRQREIAESVVKYRITVAYTGNAIGKDYLVGGVLPWWLCTRHQSLAIVTGPSQTVLGSVTWKEIRQAAQRRSDDPTGSIPLGITFSKGIKASPLTARLRDDWQALGYSTTSVERASGQHNRKLLVVVEEASGVEDEIWDAIDSLKFARMLAILNPICADGRAVRLIRQADRDRQDGVPPHLAVNAIRVSSRESPDAGNAESRFGLADKTWIDSCERNYGKNSLWVRSHIDAIIPDVSAECLIEERFLDWAASRPPRPSLPIFHPIHQTRRISCDLGEGVGRDFERHHRPRRRWHPGSRLGIGAGIAGGRAPHLRAEP